MAGFRVYDCLGRTLRAPKNSYEKLPLLEPRREIEKGSKAPPRLGACTGYHMGVSKYRGTLFWGPYNNKDPFLVTILGSHIFGNSHMVWVGLKGFGALGFRV